MQGNNVSDHREVLHTFATHLRQKYEHIEIDQKRVTRLQGGIPLTCPTKYADLLEQPIAIEELSVALRSEAKHKTKGIDDFSLEFYTANWDTIKQYLLELINRMFLHKQNHS